MAAIRRNVNITVLGHNNGIYGLTKGQASPTSTKQITSKAQPYGVFSTPFNPIATAIVQGAGFVARGFSGDKEHLPELIAKAIMHPGIAIVDILSPCVSFNKFNTFAWYKKRCQPLPADYDPTNKAAALAQAGAVVAHGVAITGRLGGTGLPHSSTNRLARWPRPFATSTSPRPHCGRWTQWRTGTSSG